MESLIALHGSMLLVSVAFAILAGILWVLGTNKANKENRRLTERLEAASKQIRSLEKAAESIRKELLETQQHQDINQLKLKSTKSSAEELRQALLDAKKRLKIAEAAIKAHDPQEPQTSEMIPPQDNEVAALDHEPDELDRVTDFLELESVNDGIDGVTLDIDLEIEGGLSESQKGQLIDLLDPGPKGNIDIFCVLGDEGSELTAKQIDETLAADGWKTNGVAKSAFADPPQGIVLVVNSKETAPSYASFLQRVLATIGLPVSAKIDKKYREWSLSVIVGIFDD
ncbi:hypothetical protein [Desulfosarcina cetonica]|uniref:hypothetical protein n=1 Tax=Desulfosarcina cetonica TaxID=90730 RepID=UPI0012ED0650|nr:hypothetical protein [Desulfosarcina cetonica]